MSTSQISLTSLPRELARAYPGASVSYRRCYTLTVDGRLPAIQGDSGRWFIDRADLPAVARVLGLSEARAKSPKTRGESRAASVAA